MTEITVPVLTGQRIKEVRMMTTAEMEAEGWDDFHEKPIVIVTENGTRVYPQSDPEGNGPGCLVASQPVVNNPDEPYNYYVADETEGA